MQNCDYCGRENEDSAYYCRECGEPFPQLTALLRQQREMEIAQRKQAREMRIRPRNRYVPLLAYGLRCFWLHRRAISMGLALGLLIGLWQNYTQIPKYRGAAQIAVEQEHADLH